MTRQYSEMQKKLMEVALGTRAPDLAVRNVDLFNVWTGRIQENVMVLVCEDRIAHVGPEDDSVPRDAGTQVVDGRGRVLIPGLIDSHTHLAWLVRPEEYVRHMLPGGTTTVITETMEIYPVAGKEGITAFLDALKPQPLRFYATLPAMGAIDPEMMGIDPDDLEALLAREEVVGLGEAYWQSVFQNPDRFLPVFDRVRRAGKCLEGHSAGARGRKLSAYAGLNITSCHEPITADQVVERLEKGLHVQIREGSIRSDLSAIASISGQGLDLSNVSLVSDGVTPERLLARGYMEDLVQASIDAGFRPEDAIRMATLNPARHFRLDQDIGSVAPGRYADMVLVPDLGTIRPEMVIAGGRIAARNQELLLPCVQSGFTARHLNTVDTRGPVTPERFEVVADTNESRIHVRAIEFVTGLVTVEHICDLSVSGGRVMPDPERDILKVVVLDRAGTPGKTFTGFVKGFGLNRGAVATSAAWDSPEIIAVGENDRDIALAVSEIARNKGGIVLAGNGEIVSSLALPVFGLLSCMTMEAAARKTAELTREIRAAGCGFDDPLLSLSTLTGAAVPYLRISSRGLVDMKTGSRVSLFPGHSASM
ncbi:MAG: adenine deaminase C-terminal domain-containing protein [Desulfobacter sp.]